MAKHIALQPRDDDGSLVVAVTFPTPWGTTKTVDVRMTDDAAYRLIADVQAILDQHTKKLMGGLSRG